MENASKALLMAASVLIGIVILSLAVYLYLTFSSSAQTIGAQMEEGQLQQFNNQFTSYMDKDNITIYDVVTVANLAKDNNAYYELTESTDNNFYIRVDWKKGHIFWENKIETKNTSEFLTPDNLENEIEGNSLKIYTCKVSYNQKTGRVNKVTFE